MKNILLNYQRLTQTEEYAFENVFQKPEYDWPGDWEGRALLAFMCHYQMHKNKAPCMEEMIRVLPTRTNEKLYFGALFDGKIVDEQQLSGHNWYLRGLVKYAETFDSEFARIAAKSVVENLYLPALNWYRNYPIKRERNGGVSGSIACVKNGWKLSTDVGCAFMCVDGLAHYYAYTRDARVKALVDEIIQIFFHAEYVKNGFQTHTTLTCARGILRMYLATGEAQYLAQAERVFDDYLRYGMTLTYENFNWFGREDTWTEPCAMVDSLILATQLYQIKKEKAYLTLARRIWLNGLQFCQRPNGGAGPNTCVTKSQPVWKVSLYEAPFCCTMRYAEGLLTYTENQELFAWDNTAAWVTDVQGRTFADDKLIVKINGKQTPAPAGYEFSQEALLELEMQVL